MCVSIYIYIYVWDSVLRASELFEVRGPVGLNVWGM